MRFQNIFSSCSGVKSDCFGHGSVEAVYMRGSNEISVGDNWKLRGFAVERTWGTAFAKVMYALLY